MLPVASSLSFINPLEIEGVSNPLSKLGIDYFSMIILFNKGVTFLLFNFDSSLTSYTQGFFSYDSPQQAKQLSLQLNLMQHGFSSCIILFVIILNTLLFIGFKP